MLLKNYRTKFIQKLTSVYDAGEAESLFYIALEELKGWRRTNLALNPDTELSSIELEKWNEVLAQLENNRPIQYIFNKAHFYGLEFTVTENTLIPRPETEELVEWIINDNKAADNMSLLDIGTGSGCIAISLSKNLPNVDVTAVDVSEAALETAKINAIHNKVIVAFRQMDILAVNSLPQKLDIIVSNPPYVRHLEKAEIHNNVLLHEPHLALFVDDNDPLIFYRKIAQLAKENLSSGGKLYFEINQYLGVEMTAMLEDFGFKDIILKRDIYGNDRMMRCSL